MPPASGSYEPVPTNDSDQNLVAEKPLQPQRSFSKRKVAALVFAFLLVALVSYKAGQWSINTTSISGTADSEDLEDTKPEVIDSTSTTTSTDTTSTETTSTEVAEMGKYSVG